MKATPNYISRLLVLGLIMCVPILNFVVAGYLLFWSREVPFGGRSLLPQKIVTGKNFEYGFYAFVLTLVVGLVGGIIGGIFGWIPFIGWVVSIAAIGGAADPSFAQIMSLIAALAGPMIFCTLILYVVLSVAETFAEAVAIRGVAHWVARYAPEWTTLSAPRY